MGMIEYSQLELICKAIQEQNSILINQHNQTIAYLQQQNEMLFNLKQFIENNTDKKG